VYPPGALGCAHVRSASSADASSLTYEGNVEKGSVICVVDNRGHGMIMNPCRQPRRVNVGIRACRKPMSTRLTLPDTDEEDAALGICEASSRLANFFSKILLVITPALDFKILALHNIRGLNAELCENVPQSVSINEGRYLQFNAWIITQLMAITAG
jgi:hypothetical protein